MAYSAILALQTERKVRLGLALDVPWIKIDAFHSSVMKKDLLRNHFFESLFEEWKLYLSEA